MALERKVKKIIPLNFFERLGRILTKYGGEFIVIGGLIYVSWAQANYLLHQFIYAIGEFINEIHYMEDLGFVNILVGVCLLIINKHLDSMRGKTIIVGILIMVCGGLLIFFNMQYWLYLLFFGIFGATLTFLGGLSLLIGGIKIRRIIRVTQTK